MFQYKIADLSVVMAVAWWIGLAHVIIGACILIEPQAILVSAFAGFKWVTSLYAPGHAVAGVMLVATGLMAMTGGEKLLHLGLALRLQLIAPQVVLLVFTLASTLCTMVEGQYPDGYVPIGGTVFIVADQIVAALISLFHIASVLMLSTQTRDEFEWS